VRKLFIAIGIIAVIAGGIFYVLSNLDMIVEGLIEKHGSAATQTPVRVAGVSINLRDANASISRLTVGNPDGFPGNAIEMEGFAIELDAASLNSDVIVIEELLVRGARIDVLQQANGNNVQELLRNLDSDESSEPDESAEAGKKIIIDRFVLEGAGASLSAPDLDEVREVDLPTITLRDIGRRENGATGREVARQVLRPVLQEALESAAVQAIKDKASDKIDEVTDAVLEGIFGGEKKTEE
jgi:uncharacterized protein involved in outer membrane biogenesis